MDGRLDLNFGFRTPPRRPQPNRFSWAPTKNRDGWMSSLVDPELKRKASRILFPEELATNEETDAWIKARMEEAANEMDGFFFDFDFDMGGVGSEADESDEGFESGGSSLAEIVEPIVPPQLKQMSMLDYFPVVRCAMNSGMRVEAAALEVGAGKEIVAAAAIAEAFGAGVFKKGGKKGGTFVGLAQSAMMKTYAWYIPGMRAKYARPGKRIQMGKAKRRAAVAGAAFAGKAARVSKGARKLGMA